MTTFRHATGHPRPLRLLHDGTVSLRSQAVASLTIILVVAIVCVVVLATTGRSAASEREVLSAIDSSGTRLIKVSDDQGSAAIDAASVGLIAGINGVDWVVGLGPVVDVHNAAWPASGTGTPMRTVYGDTAKALPVTTGRVPDAGEAVEGSDAATTLGMPYGSGGVVTAGSLGSVTSAAIVGIFAPDPALADLGRLVLVQGTATQQATVRYIYVLAHDVSDVDRVSAAVSAAIKARSPLGVTVETAASMLQLREALSGTMTRAARAQMLLVLAVGLALVMVTLFSATSARRRDYGRRRALGASRSAIIALILIHALLAAAIGAAVGTAAGLAVLARMSAGLPAPAFVAGVALLAVAGALVAAVPPGLAAAYRDPATILRVP